MISDIPWNQKNAKDIYWYQTKVSKNSTFWKNWRKTEVDVADLGIDQYISVFSDILTTADVPILVYISISSDIL